MAIEWNIYEPEPVSRLALVEASDRFAERLLGEKLLDFALSHSAASRADDGAEFDSEVFAVCGDATALVDLNSARIDDEGRPAEEAEGDDLVIAGTVTARRTLFSAALGLTVALAWLDAGGGQLAGSGLDRALYREELDAVVETLVVSEATGIAAVEQLGRRVAGSRAAWRFS
jgi:hypothetical protein